MTDLRAIEVSLEVDRDTGHTWIWIEPATAGAYEEAAWMRLGRPTDQDLQDTGLHLAGVLGRVAAAAHPFIAKSYDEHGCNPNAFTRGAGDLATPWFTARCQMTEDGVLNPTHAECWAPRLGLCVPTADTKLWLRRVQHWLAEVAAGISESGSHTDTSAAAS